MIKLLYMYVISLIFLTSMVLMPLSVEAESYGAPVLCPGDSQNLTDEDMLRMPDCIRAEPEVGQKLCHLACGNPEIGSYVIEELGVSENGSMGGYCINSTINKCLDGCEDVIEWRRGDGELWCYRYGHAIDVGSPNYSFELKCFDRIQ